MIEKNPEIREKWKEVLEKIEKILRDRDVRELDSIEIVLHTVEKNPWFEACIKEFPKEKWGRCSDCPYISMCSRGEFIVEKRYVGREDLEELVKVLNKIFSKDI